jgi:hypothetical protein
VCCVILLPASAARAGDWPQYEAHPFVIRLGIPAGASGGDSAGGMVVADLDGDGRPDYLVTSRGHIACHAHGGAELWSRAVDVRVGGSSEREGLPGHHGPGVTAGDTNGDGRAEVLFLTRDGLLHVVDGATGEARWHARPPAPEGAEAWEHLALANFRGEGDRDILLQATNAEGYRMGRYLAAFALEELRAGDYSPLWQRDDFLACAHNGARLADLDLDGRDEVIGGTIIGPDGTRLYTVPLKGHIDSVFVQDVRPDLPGLEVVALEEGGDNRVFLYGMRGLIWETHYQHWEPQNAAVGDFDPESPGLEIWCRSRFNTDQKPFVFNARGELMTAYELKETAPADWTNAGVEVIWTVDWTGGPAQFAAAKERHTEGDIAVFAPMTGSFAWRADEAAARLFVADVSGDWREELVVLADGELRVYHNPAPNPRPGRARLWEQPHYRRAKMTWNYYSP